MNRLDKLSGRFAAPRLTRTRIVLALAAALVADGLQILLGPLGWAGADEVIDVIALGLTTWILGFHLLLLPTFVVEFIPVADMLPSWTACVIAVIALRKREQRASTVVDVTSRVESPPQIGSGPPTQGSETRPR